MDQYNDKYLYLITSCDFRVSILSCRCFSDIKFDNFNSEMNYEQFVLQFESF